MVNCSASPQWVVNVYIFGLKSDVEGSVAECFDPRGGGGGVLSEKLGRGVWPTAALCATERKEDR